MKKSAGKSKVNKQELEYTILPRDEDLPFHPREPRPSDKGATTTGSRGGDPGGLDR